MTFSSATNQLSVAVQTSNQGAVHNRVFDWAEHQYPELLSAGSLNQTLPDGTIFRCYSSGFCIGYRPGVFLTYDGVAIREVGTEADLLRQAEAQGF